MELFGLLLSLLIIGTTIMLWAYNWFAYLPRLKAGQAPYPKGGLGFPLFGQTLELFYDFKRCPDNFLRKRIARYGKGGGLFKTHLFGSPTIITTNPHTLKTIAMDSENFGPGWPKSATTLAGAFLTRQGDDYKRLRRLGSSAVTATPTLEKLITLVQSLTVEALDKWSRMGEILLIDEMLKLTFNVIATILLGSLQAHEIDEFCNEFQLLNNGLRALPINIPGFPYHAALKARSKIEKRIQRHMEDRLASPNVQYGDVLESLMILEDEEHKKLSQEEVVDCLITFLLAGHESSAHGGMWIMIFLSKHPQKLEKLIVEQTRIANEKGQPHQGLSLSDFKQMNYMKAVIDETLRIVNISPFTFRKSFNSFELNGYTIPKNWSIALWHRANHMDENNFKDPYTFNPERWEDLKVKQGMYTPFGIGARSCIGMDLAKLELAIFVHTLIINYRWELVNPKQNVIYLPRPKPSDNCPVRIFRK